jgi:hypothetical protein
MGIFLGSLTRYGSPVRHTGNEAVRPWLIPHVSDDAKEHILSHRTARTLVVTALAACLATSVAPAAQAAVYCDPTWVYSVSSNTPNDMRVFDRHAVVNGTGSTITGSFTAESSGTVSATASVSLTAEASAAVFAKVSATVNASVTKSMTATIGVTATSSVNPYSTLNGDYGIYRENVTMKRYYLYSNCSAGAASYFSYSAPYRKAWKLYY